MSYRDTKGASLGAEYHERGRQSAAQALLDPTTVAELTEVCAALRASFPDLAAGQRLGAWLVSIGRLRGEADACVEEWMALSGVLEHAGWALENNVAPDALASDASLVALVREVVHGS